MTRYVMVIDQRRCIGCHSCTVACRTWNKLPLDIVYNPVVTEGAQGNLLDEATGKRYDMSYAPIEE